jgi:aspartyl-tRNA(Asn)/glutamyl-tRNA(Gln) amidotransferase subunit C
MIIDKDTVSDIAHLARLELDKNQTKQMATEMNEILDWMKKLSEVNTDNVEPLIHISEEVNVLRNDEVNNELEHERGLMNAPKRDSNYFRVPKVIE